VGVSDFERVLLRSGEASIRERRSGEVMHPGLGPRREAELLYVEQTRLAERLRADTPDPVRVLDVGLGAATNALAVLACAQRVDHRRLVLTSLERDNGPLRLALAEPASFPVQAEHRELLESLLGGGRVERPGVSWVWNQGDALERMAELSAQQEIICYDPFSPDSNPELWTLEAFRVVRRLLAPGGIVSTYSASTRTRVTLLLAGFWVGAGVTAAVKETTVASDGPAALERPLGPRWLQRWARSSARAPYGIELTPEIEQRIRSHPQFIEAAEKEH
jgi:tRNA U34 5-methylaminomethyl-2-thiouridine-forming methyltransferase MnmC